MKQIKIEDFKNQMREAVLKALDECMVSITDFEGAKGWRDTDLPNLFAALDAHSNNVASRFNETDSDEQGSALVKFIKE